MKRKQSHRAAWLARFDGPVVCFTRREIEEIFRSLGVKVPTQQKFWGWTKSQNALVPPTEPLKRRRDGDRWDVSGVILLRWIQTLRGDRVPLQRIRKAFAYLRKHLPEVIDSPHAWAFIVTPDRNPILVRRGDRVGTELLRASGQGVFLDALTVQETVKAARRLKEE